MDSPFHILRPYAASRCTKALVIIAVGALALVACQTAGADGEIEGGLPWWAEPGWQVGVGVLGAAAIAAAAFVVKRRKERRLEEGALEERFSDALTRFSDGDNPEIRAAAAGELAEMACARYPGRRARLTLQNHPFFARAASRLAAAVCSEEEQEVREAVLSGLQSVVDFGKRGDQALLRVQITELARANRSCKQAFVRALGEYCSLRRDVTSDVDESLWPLLALAPLCRHEAGTLACLRDLAGTKGCQEAADAFARRRQAENPAEGSRPEKGVLERLRAGAACLKDSEAALSDALRALLRPRDTPADAQELSDWTPEPDALDLRECCLTGADLEGCRLWGADLSHAELHGVGFRSAELAGATFDDAHMQWATLDEALLRGAQLKNARLQSADLGHARLRKANLSGARLHGAVLRRADLRDACLDGAQLENADLIAAKLQGASLIRANVQGAHLFKAVVEESEGDSLKIAYFTGANWWDADFTHPRSGRLDRNLVKWLSERFPRPTEDAGTQPPE